MNRKHVTIIRWLIGAAFFIYLLLLFDLVFLSAEFGRTNAEVLRYQKVNFVPFSTIKKYVSVMGNPDPSLFMTNIIGNIVAFLPFGFLIPVLVEKLRRWYWSFILAFALSMFIELVQGYRGIGVMDVDDVILNVMGGIMGYWLFLILGSLLRIAANKRIG